MAMHTYVHVYVFTSIPMYVCFLTYEAGTILTSKVVKPHTCVNVYVCMYVHMVCMQVCKQLLCNCSLSSFMPKY